MLQLGKYLNCKFLYVVWTEKCKTFSWLVNLVCDYYCFFLVTTVLCIHTFINKYCFYCNLTHRLLSPATTKLLFCMLKVSISNGISKLVLIYCIGTVLWPVERPQLKKGNCKPIWFMYLNEI